MGVALSLIPVSKFLCGIAYLATCVHGKGLKFGIYIVPGLNRSVYSANSPIAGTSLHARDIADTPSQENTKSGNAYKIVYKKPGTIQYIQSYANFFAS